MFTSCLLDHHCLSAGTYPWDLHFLRNPREQVLKLRAAHYFDYCAQPVKLLTAWVFVVSQVRACLLYCGTDGPGTQSLWQLGNQISHHSLQP